MSVSTEDRVVRFPDPATTRERDGATAFRLGYRPWLDGLRGIAILAVLGLHLKLLNGGHLGVDVFFVLSGFLITTLLVEEWQRNRSISLRRFYLRRALRLWPALFVLLFLCGLASFTILSTDAGSALRQEILVSACYVTNYPSLHGVGMQHLGHTWSLSVEEQFYLVWPILLYAMLRIGLRRWIILGIVIAGIVASAWLRTVLYNRGPSANIWRVYLGLDTRADSLLVGCLFGLFVGWGMLPKSRLFFWLNSLAALLSAGLLLHLFRTSYHMHHQLYRGLFTGVALMVGCILIRLVSSPSVVASRILEFKPLVGIGRISYALYLFHIPIIQCLQPVGLGWNYPTETGLVLVLSFAAAILSWYGVERPCLRLKHRFSSSGQRSTPDAMEGVVSNLKRAA